MGAIAVGLTGAAWPTSASPWLAAAGVVVVLAGVALLVAGGAGLGPQLTPFPRPVDGGELRRDGVYGLVRHPMYGGALLVDAGVGAALLAAGAGTARRRGAVPRRQAASRGGLVDRQSHTGYADYRRQVRRRFIPFVW